MNKKELKVNRTWEEEDEIFGKGACIGAVIGGILGFILGFLSIGLAGWGAACPFAIIGMPLGGIWYSEMKR